MNSGLIHNCKFLHNFILTPSPPEVLPRCFEKAYREADAQAKVEA